MTITITNQRADAMRKTLENIARDSSDKNSVAAAAAALSADDARREELVVQAANATVMNRLRKRPFVGGMRHLPRQSLVKKLPA